MSTLSSRLGALVSGMTLFIACACGSLAAGDPPPGRPAGEQLLFPDALDDHLTLASLHPSPAAPSLGVSEPAFQAHSSLGSASVLSSELGRYSMGAGEGGSGVRYIVARAGPMKFIDDLKDLDIGLNAEAAIGAHIIPFLALEISGGYMRGEEDHGPDEHLIQSIPIVFNAMVTIPLVFLEIYAGGGVGGYYIKSELENTGMSRKTEEDIVFGGNLFAGVSFDIGPLILGVQGKYILTEKTDGPQDNDFKLQGFAIMAVAGFGF